MTAADGTVRILVGSAGRRPYLLHWFREAVERLGRRASIEITEADPRAVTAAVADVVHRVPPYPDPDFATAMVDLVDRTRPDLFLSLNDHELTCLAGTLADKLRGYGGVVLALAPERQQLAADKHAMAIAFDTYGIVCPMTVLGSDEAGVRAVARTADRLVIKDRFGSGSSGFAVVRPDGVRAALDHRGQDLELLIVQPFLTGVEYGMDVIGDLAGTGAVTGVLARRKDGSAQGVTTRVVTEDPAPFRPLAESIAHVIGPQGPVDVDLVRSATGLHVLDVNPRFGGGYPFSHCAGSDVPGYLVAELLGAPAPSGWDTCRIGLTVGRYDSFVPIG